MDYIICDIDGTIADLDHRRDLVEDKERPDWDQFFAEAIYDTPKKEIIELVKDSRYNVVFVTGRPERIREETKDWMVENGIFNVGLDEVLYMRDDGDYRPDEELKEEIYKEEIKPRFGEPELVLDDRRKVVDMWRNLGLTCIQVAQGDF